MKSASAAWSIADTPTRQRLDSVTGSTSEGGSTSHAMCRPAASDLLAVPP